MQAFYMHFWKIALALNNLPELRNTRLVRKINLGGHLSWLKMQITQQVKQIQKITHQKIIQIPAKTLPTRIRHRTVPKVLTVLTVQTAPIAPIAPTALTVQTCSNFWKGIFYRFLSYIGYIIAI